MACLRGFEPPAFGSGARAWLVKLTPVGTSFKSLIQDRAGKWLEGSTVLQQGQARLGILDFGQAGVGVFPDVEEFHLSLCPATGTSKLGEYHE